MGLFTFGGFAKIEVLVIVIIGDNGLDGSLAVSGSEGVDHEFDIIALLVICRGDAGEVKALDSGEDDGRDEGRDGQGARGETKHHDGVGWEERRMGFRKERMGQQGRKGRNVKIK